MTRPLQPGIGPGKVVPHPGGPAQTKVVIGLRVISHRMFTLRAI